MKQIIRLTESDLCRLIEESVEQILKETRSINSPKLYNIIQQHGGIKSNRGVFDIHINCFVEAPSFTVGRKQKLNYITNV